MSSAHRLLKTFLQLGQHPRQICRMTREEIQLWKELLPCSLDPDPTGKGPHPRKGLSFYFQIPKIIELKVSYHLTMILSKHIDHKWKQKHCISKYRALYSSVLFYGFVPQRPIFQSHTEDRKLSGIHIKSNLYFTILVKKLSVQHFFHFKQNILKLNQLIR